MQRVFLAGLAVAAIMAAGTAAAEDARTLADYDGCSGLPVVVTEQAPASEAREASARERIGSMIDTALARTQPGDGRPLIAATPRPDTRSGS